MLNRQKTGSSSSAQSARSAETGLAKAKPATAMPVFNMIGSSTLKRPSFRLTDSQSRTEQ